MKKIITRFVVINFYFVKVTPNWISILFLRIGTIPTSIFHKFPTKSKSVLFDKTTNTFYL